MPMKMNLVIIFIAVSIAADAVISQICTRDEQCLAPIGSYCITGECKCSNYQHLNRNGTKCIESTVFHGNCDPSEETCGLRMACREDGVCVCDENHRYAWDWLGGCVYEQSYKEPCDSSAMFCGKYGSNMECRNGVCECLEGFHYDKNSERCRNCEIPLNIDDNCRSGEKCCAAGSACVHQICMCGKNEIYVGLEDRCAPPVEKLICNFFSRKHMITTQIEDDAPFDSGNGTMCCMTKINIYLEKFTSPCTLRKRIIYGGKQHRFYLSQGITTNGRIYFGMNCTKNGKNESKHNAIAFAMHTLRAIVYTDDDRPYCPSTTMHLRDPQGPSYTAANEKALREAKDILEYELEKLVIRNIYSLPKNDLMARLECLHKFHT